MNRCASLMALRIREMSLFDPRTCVLPLKRRYLRNLALRIADIPKSILIRWPMLLHFAEWQHVLPGMTAIRIAEGVSPLAISIASYQPALGG